VDDVVKGHTNVVHQLSFANSYLVVKFARVILDLSTARMTIDCYEDFVYMYARRFLFTLLLSTPYWKRMVRM
jgi:hypothetical protein